MPYATPAARGVTRRRSRRRRAPRILRGLLAAVGVTLLSVVVFALLMQWLRPSDTAVRVVNQLIKLASIFVGVWAMVGRGGEKGMTWGALLGLAYMALGVGLYAVGPGYGLSVLGRKIKNAWTRRKTRRCTDGQPLV